MAPKKSTKTRTENDATASTAKPNAKTEQEENGLDILKSKGREVRLLAEKVAKAFGKGKGHRNGGSNGGAKDTEDQAGHIQQQPHAQLRELGRTWLRYGDVEDEIVFPMLSDAGIAEADLCHAEVQRDLATLLLADMAAREHTDPLFAQEAGIFCDMVQKLCRFEETRLFNPAKKTELDTSALAARLKDRLEEAEDTAEEKINIPRPRHLRVAGLTSKEYEHMPMRGQNRERDEHGRFMDDDDHRGSSRGGYSSRSSSSGRGRHDEDERGWHGDPRGHSEASRRGWETRRGGEGGGGGSRGGRYEDDDDDRGYASRGRSSSGSRGGQRSGGWFGDSEGHSEASRRGWQNSDHGDSGWYGDSERHAQASRRGWQNPDHGESGWYGDSEGHSQASRRGWQNSDHGDSGWYGDPEGHSQASRRGWQSRRDDDEDDHRGRRSSSRRGRD